MKTNCKILTTLFMLTIFFGCSSSSNKLNESDTSAIMKADIDFCEYSKKEGFYKAFLKYADEGIIKLSDGSYPMVGKKEVEKLYGDKSGTKELIWAPVYGEVAQSGELGYTWGQWHFTDRDTTYYGKYFTVWKKQENGSWKVALDGGNSTPPPKK